MNAAIPSSDRAHPLHAREATHGSAGEPVVGVLNVGNLESPTGFEPVTPSLQVRCSTELSYGGPQCGSSLPDPVLRLDFGRAETKLLGRCPHRGARHLPGSRATYTSPRSFHLAKMGLICCSAHFTASSGLILSVAASANICGRT